MLVRISDFTNSDYIADIPSHLLALNVVTHAQNIRLRAGKLQKFKGSALTYTAPSVAPRHLLHGRTGTQDWWMVLGLQKAYSMIDAAYTNLTTATTFSATEEGGWVSDVLHGTAVLTNGTEAPWKWTGTGQIAALDNWPASTVCTSLRAYKNYLVAVGLTEGATFYPEVVRWSHPADPGSVPASWDYTNTTYDAGRIPLSDTSGYLVDSLSLGELHMIYKNDATYTMQYIGGQFIHRFTKLATQTGMMAKNCGASFGRQQLILGENDITITDGVQLESAVDRRLRTHIFSNLSDAYRNRSFVVHHPSKREIWVCVPVDYVWPNRAYVYNYGENKWMVRDLPGVAHIASGRVQSVGTTFNLDSGTINSDTALIGNVFATNLQLLAADYVNTRLPSFETSNQEVGANMTSYAEHRSYDFREVQGISAETIKHITRIRPHFSADSTTGGVVLFQIGTQMALGDAITWSSELSYTIGTTRDLWLNVNGRYISWRVKSTTDIHWELDGLDLEVAKGGYW